MKKPWAPDQDMKNIPDLCLTLSVDDDVGMLREGWVSSEFGIKA